MRSSLFIFFITIAVLGLINAHAVPEVQCTFGSEPPPANATGLDLKKSHKSKGTIKQQWQLPYHTPEVSLYSKGSSKKRSMILQPASSADSVYRTYRVTLINAAKKYGGGQYTIKIPEGQDKCTINLLEKGMDVSAVSVW